MTDLEKLKNTTDLSDFAKLLGYKPKFLSYILYKIPPESKYREFDIPKKNGGVRKIKAPTEKLKHLQRRLSDILNSCLEELSDKQKKKDKLSHGFRKKLSIVTNAARHRKKRFVFNLDLQDFFPSINFGRVRGFFINNSNFQLEPAVATIMAQIAFDDNELPQGSPCSPVISNLLAHHLDIRLSSLAAKAKCTYTRYADDLTFSTNRSDFSTLIAAKDSEEIWGVGKKLRSEIKRTGFSINDGKTSMQFKTSRQIVTGLVVNKKVNVKRDYYRRARSMCISLFTKDEFYISDSNQVETATENQANTENQEVQQIDNQKVKGTLNQLEGILSFIYQIKGLHDERESTEKRKSPTSIMTLYRKFLFYKHFFALDKPLLVCEGKTDIIYLKCALKQLSASYPDMIECNEDGEFFRISYLNMTENLKEILSISEGTGGLSALMTMYEKYMLPFKGQGKKHPVVFLIDNDDGAGEIKKKLKSYSPEKLYFHFTENLYVVHTPQADDGSDTAIEDLFPAEVLAKQIDGKKFNKKNQLDSATEYGKIVFAEKVVKANQKNINFDGFKGVFDRIEAAKSDYQQRLADPDSFAKEEETKPQKKRKRVKSPKPRDSTCQKSQ